MELGLVKWFSVSNSLVLTMPILMLLHEMGQIIWKLYMSFKSGQIISLLSTLISYEPICSEQLTLSWFMLRLIMADGWYLFMLKLSCSIAFVAF